MLYIKASDGTILQRSRNLRGVRSVLGSTRIEGLSIRHSADGGAWLDIKFRDGVLNQTSKFAGASFHADFADFSVLCEFVRRWRNVYGAALYVDGQRAGDVSYSNAALAAGEEAEDIAGRGPIAETFEQRKARLTTEAGRGSKS